MSDAPEAKGVIVTGYDGSPTAEKAVRAAADLARALDARLHVVSAISHDGAAHADGAEHWSVGGRSRLESSTFDNYDLTVRVAPAIEYSVWSYDESSNRGLTVLYDVGVTRFDYDKVTVFKKKRRKGYRVKNGHRQPFTQLEINKIKA